MAEECTSYAKGVMGESAALRFLEEKGMKLLRRRYKAGRGEIDLILLDQDVLVFAEVKSREKGGTEAASLAVTPSKQRRLADAACFFLGEHPEYADAMMRFDVITVTAEGVCHYPNAFSAQNDVLI